MRMLACPCGSMAIPDTRSPSSTRVVTMPCMPCFAAQLHAVGALCDEGHMQGPYGMQQEV